ncbi:MAG: glycosyl transferase [Acidithiobacillales bacterium SG8_45]|jgi:glycosyltransferase involved in cell wall biosynthesis|nr:MAG: glycosyl transferase [Acidithiobacillales bacterium SG8_45]
MEHISIVLPARNEASSLKSLLPEIVSLCNRAEIIVVNDGSSDNTEDVARSLGIKVVNHPYSMGNGAAIKSGTRAATGKVILFMDADGQHDPRDIEKMVKKYNDGYDMVVGARNLKSHASFVRQIANRFFNRLASLMTGFKVEDLTSGFRIVNARKFRRFLYLLPNGFSYPTTSTMAFFRSGYSVGYIPIAGRKREGKSKIRLLHDGLRFIVIILKIGALFSPMRLFLPISFLLFMVGSLYYGYTYYTSGRFTNMSAVIILSSLTSFLIGIVSEQISSLHYRISDRDNES